MSLPDNQAKLEVVEKLAVLAEDAGMTLIDMAMAFVLEHPAVTSVIVGPRTIEHLETYLSAAESRLDAGLLDEIDRIVPPGSVISESDIGFTPPAIADAAARRRKRTAE